MDIQQTFSVYYSAAKRFGTGNPYNIAHVPAGQSPQHSALKPLSTKQAVTQRGDVTSAKDQGITVALLHYSFFTDDLVDDVL